MKATIALSLLAFVGVILVLRSQVSEDHENRRLLAAFADAMPKSRIDNYCSYNPVIEQNNYTIQWVYDDVRRSLNTWRNGNNLLVDLMSGRTRDGSSYAYSLIFLGILPLVGAGILILGFLICLLWSCISCCWPVGKEKPTERPKVKLIIFFVFMLIFVFGFNAVFLSTSSSVRSRSKDMVCSAYYGVDVYGKGVNLTLNNKTYLFEGILKAESSIQQLNETYFNATQNISWFNNVSAEAEELSRDYNYQIQMIEYMIEMNNNSEFANPDPFKNGTLPSGYIQNLGPLESNTSVGGLVKLEIDQQYNAVINSSAVVNEIIPLFKDSSNCSNSTNNTKTIFGIQLSNDTNCTNTTAYFTEIIEDAVDYINKTARDYRRFMKDLRSTTDAALQYGVNYWSTFSTISVIVGPSVIVLAAIVVFMFRKHSGALSCCLHCVWLFLVFFTLVALFFSVFLSVGGQVAIDGCDVVGGLLTNRRNLTELLGNKSNVDAAQQCIFGEGDWLSQNKFYANATKKFNNFAAALSQMSQLKDNLTAQPNLVSLTNAKYFAEGVQSGNNTPFSNYVLDPLINTVTVLSSWSDSSNNATYQSYYGNCSVSKDQWALNSGKCANGSYINPANATERFGEESCLVLSEWSPATFSQRYNEELYSTCQNITEAPFDQFKTVEGNIEGHFNALENYLKSANTVMTPILGNMSNIELEYNVSFSKDLSGIVNTLALVNEQISELTDALSYSNATGFLNTTNCKFVQHTMNNVFYYGCNGLMPVLQGYALLSGIVGAIGLIVTLITWFLAVKFARRDFALEDTNGNHGLGFYTHLEQPINQP